MPRSSWSRIDPHAIVFAFFACFVAFSANISAPLTDNFHEGEFLGFLWHMLDYYQGKANFPILVHGGMDYLPSLVAHQLYGFQKTIVGTHLILLILTALQYFLFLHTTYLLIGKKEDRLFWSSLILMYFLVVTPPLDAPVIEASYFPVRDLFLSLVLWFLVQYAQSGGSRRWWLLGAGSLSCALSLLWCYNRGVIALAFFVVFWIGVVVRKRVAAAVLMPATLLGALALLDRWRIFGSWQENFRNIVYWIRHGSEVNRLRFQFEYITGYAGLATLFLFAAAVLAAAIYLHRKSIFGDELNVFIVAGLFAIQALNIKVVFGVPDLEYALHGGWPSVMLLLFYGSRVWKVETAGAKMILSGLSLTLSDLKHARLPIKGVLASFILFLVVCHHHIFVPHTRFLKNLLLPVANDRIVSQDIQELSAVVKASGDDCFFNWVNDDVVAFLAGKKHCTDYPYVHYVGASQEQLLLAQLKESSPSEIVVHAEFWPFTRNQENMSERLPNTYRYIAGHYSHLKHVGNYQVVFRNL